MTSYSCILDTFARIPAIICIQKSTEELILGKYAFDIDAKPQITLHAASLFAGENP